MNLTSSNNKSGFTLFELIFSIVILAVIVSSSMMMLDLLHTENKSTFDTALQKIDFETTRLFLQNKIKNDKNLNYLAFDTHKLFYQNNLLLEDVSSFSKTSFNGFISVNICIKKTNNFCTTFQLKQ